MQVSPNGSITAVGNGQDTVIITNSGKTAGVLVHVQIGNSPPALSPLGDQTLTTGSTVNIPITVTDPDGNHLTISAVSLPPFASITDNGNGTGFLHLAPGQNDAGVHTVTITALDDGEPNLGAAQTIMINVVAPLALGALSLTNAEVGVAYNKPLVTGGLPPYNITLTKGVFAPGLSGDVATGRLTGTPTSTANKKFTAQITDQVSASVTGVFKIKVLAAVSISTNSLKAGTTGKAYKGTLTKQSVI